MMKFNFDKLKYILNLYKFSETFPTIEDMYYEISKFENPVKLKKVLKFFSNDSEWKKVHKQKIEELLNNLIKLNYLKITKNKIYHG